MRTAKILAVVLISLATVACAAPGADARATDEAQILALEKEWVDALVRDDAEALERILAPDFTFVEPDGRVQDRAAYLDDCEKNANDTSSFVNDELRVRWYGDSAVVSGHATVREEMHGKAYAYELRWQEIWFKRGGRWQVVCSQGTPVNPDWQSPFAK